MSGKRTRFTLDLDPMFQRRLKVMASLKGTTMRQYCLIAVERELDNDEATGARSLPFGKEALDRLASLRDEVFGGRRVPDDSTELIREAREARSREL